MLSQNNPTISVAQALMILIEKYRETPQYAELRKLYVLGAITEQDAKSISSYLLDPALKGYEISTDPAIINEDASRRYFETHLAFQMLKHELNSLTLPLLNELYSTFISLFTNTDETMQTELNKVLQGDTGVNHPYWSEYADAIHRLNSPDKYTHFSPQEKEKLILLMKLSYLAVKYTSLNNETLPIAIYKKDLFAPENRGKLMKEDQTTTDQRGKKHVSSSHNYGILKSYHPVAATDIARSEAQFRFTRPADQSTFAAKSLWAQQNFKLLVHPYSNSISGTLLCIFRVLKYIKDSANKQIFNNEVDLMVFLRSFMSGLIYNSGGHSYNEFTTLLEIADIQQNMNFIPGFSGINAERLLMSPASPAVDLAINETIEYNTILLTKSKTNALIRRTG